MFSLEKLCVLVLSMAIQPRKIYQFSENTQNYVTFKVSRTQKSLNSNNPCDCTTFPGNALKSRFSYQFISFSHSFVWDRVRLSYCWNIWTGLIVHLKTFSAVREKLRLQRNFLDPYLNQTTVTWVRSFRSLLLKSHVKSKEIKIIVVSSKPNSYSLNQF